MTRAACAFLLFASSACVGTFGAPQGTTTAGDSPSIDGGSFGDTIDDAGGDGDAGTGGDDGDTGGDFVGDGGGTGDGDGAGDDDGDGAGDGDGFTGDAPLGDFGPGETVTVSWDAPTQNVDGAPAQVVGYAVYFGTNSGEYNRRIEVGNVTSATIGGLISGSTLYFTVAAINDQGRQSRMSSEFVYAVP